MSVVSEQLYRSIRRNGVGPCEVWCSKQEWLQAVLEGKARPKPPEYWLDEQEDVEHRSRRAASIIWSQHYSASRKYVIWDQAREIDFILAGYMRG